MAYTVKTCKYCEREVHESVHECPNCGASKFVDRKRTVDAPSSYAPPPPPPTPARTNPQPAYTFSKKTIFAIAAVIIGFIIFIYIITSSSSELTSSKFISTAESSGYYVYIDEDYDGFLTYWAGAFKLKPGVTKPDGSDDLELENASYYWIDYTRDTSIRNAQVEYNRYVDGGYYDGNVISKGVRNIGTVIKENSGSNYQFIVSESSTQFAIAYRIDKVNILAIVPIEFKSEVNAFFGALDLKF